jgi:hypothetical protein
MRKSQFLAPFWTLDPSPPLLIPPLSASLEHAPAVAYLRRQQAGLLLRCMITPLQDTHQRLLLAAWLKLAAPALPISASWVLL